MDEKDYKKDEDGHFIIAESVPVIFNSVLAIKEETKGEDDDKKD